MKHKVYIETTIPSYLTSWLSRDLVIAAHQQITREWWQKRNRFDLFISQVVVQEVSGGNSQVAVKRLKVLENIRVLEVTKEAIELAQKLVDQGPIPEKAAVDALHIAIAVVNGMDYLLTWNCSHIANASMRTKIDHVCQSSGYEPPAICTPEELMEE